LKRFFIVLFAIFIGSILGYFLIGGYVNKFFKGRLIDILILIILMVAIIAIIAIGVKIADFYFDFIPK
jgi:hypothetical protein